LKLIQLQDTVFLKLADNYIVHFRQDSFHELLGFNIRDNISRPGETESDKMMNILKTQKIFIFCDIIKGSKFRGKNSTILYSFGNNKRFGAGISLRPNPLQEQLLNIKSFNRIIFQFKNEKGQPIDFMGSNISMTIQIRQV